MEIKQIKELMAAMGRSGIKKLHFKKEGVELELETEGHHQGDIEDFALDFPEELNSRKETEKRRNAAFARGQELSASLAPPPPQQDQAEAARIYVTSPMVGTFYSSSAPDEPSFVKVGSTVDKNAVVCIIEAMKVMNEVKSGVAGVVAEVLIENGQPVEFGTKLFRIE